MKWSIDELTDIRALVGELLDEIGLHSYVFDIEQDENDWIVAVDFPHHDAWQALSLRVEKETFQDCLTQPKAREALTAAWRSQLERLS